MLPIQPLRLLRLQESVVTMHNAICFYDFFSKDGSLFDTLDTNKATQILIEVEGEKFQRDAKYTFNFTISEFQVQFTIVLTNRTKKCPIFSMAFMLGI